MLAQEVSVPQLLMRTGRSYQDITGQVSWELFLPLLCFGSHMEWILFSPEDFGRVDYRDHLSLTGFWFVFCLSWKVWKFLNKGFLIVLFVVG